MTFQPPLRGYIGEGRTRQALDIIGFMPQEKQFLCVDKDGHVRFIFSTDINISNTIPQK